MVGMLTLMEKMFKKFLPKNTAILMKSKLKEEKNSLLFSNKEMKETVGYYLTKNSSNPNIKAMSKLLMLFAHKNKMDLDIAYFKLVSETLLTHLYLMQLFL